jgi:hypothetical protein
MGRGSLPAANVREEIWEDTCGSILVLYSALQVMKQNEIMSIHVLNGAEMREGAHPGRAVLDEASKICLDSETSCRFMWCHSPKK